MTRKLLATAAVALALTVVLATPANAEPWAPGTCSYNGTSLSCSGSTGNLSATATFTISGNNLVIVVTNTGPGDSSIGPAELLGALFFNVAGDPVLTSGGAALTSGSSIVGGSGNVGDHWSYVGPGLNTSSAAFGDRDYGISAVGYSVGFNGTNLMSGLNDPGQPDGPDWMLGPSTFDSSTCQGTTCGIPVIVNSATFTLVIPSGATLNLGTDINGVVFQWGTSIDQTVVPEPGTLLLFGTGLIGLAGAVRRRMSK